MKPNIKPKRSQLLSEQKKQSPTYLLRMPNRHAGKMALFLFTLSRATEADTGMEAIHVKTVLQVPALSQLPREATLSGP